MALKPVVFPAVYERVTPVRTPEQIEHDWNTRFDSPASAPRTVASTPLAPPPPDGSQKTSKTISRQPSGRPAKKAPGRPSRKAAVPNCAHLWKKIGKSRTAGKVRRRCSVCKCEETIPATL